MYPAYWVAAAALLTATVLGVSLGQPMVVAAATVLFVGGGMPHGAYDIALLRRTVAIDRHGISLVVTCYVGLVLAMALLWASLPLVALVVFLITSARHFGEDWSALDEPLLRFAAGAAVIAAATIGHPEAVSMLFVGMSDARAQVIVDVIIAAAPVTLLVTAVGIWAAWHEGSRHWATAMVLCLGLLILLPPVIGFALFFVFLHSPRHLDQTRVLLSDLTVIQWWTIGGALSGVAIIGWIALQHLLPPHADATLTTGAFQLLAAVALPHLVLSRWLVSRLVRVEGPEHAR